MSARRVAVFDMSGRVFDDRRDAGRKLGERLRPLAADELVVVARARERRAPDAARSAIPVLLVPVEMTTCLP